MVRRAADVHEDKPKKESIRFNEPPWRDSRGCTTITHDRSIHPSITCDPYNFSSVAPMLPSIEHSLDHSNDSKIIFHFFSFVSRSIARIRDIIIRDIQKFYMKIFYNNYCPTSPFIRRSGYYSNFSTNIVRKTPKQLLPIPKTSHVRATHLRTPQLPSL